MDKTMDSKGEEIDKGQEEKKSCIEIDPGRNEGSDVGSYGGATVYDILDAEYSDDGDSDVIVLSDSEDFEENPSLEHVHSAF